MRFKGDIMIEKVRRPLLLTGLILDVICYTFLFLGTIILTSSSVSDYGLDTTGLTGVFYFLMIVSIVGIVFSSIGLGVCSKPYSVYKNRGGFIFTAFIILCVFMFFLLIGLLSGGSEGAGSAVISLIIMGLSATFTIVGHIKAKQDNELVFKSPNEGTFEDAYDKIEKLTKLRELNVISEEEYEALKQKQIDDLNK
jgi:hypothetical protein